MKTFEALNIKISARVTLLINDQKVDSKRPAKMLYVNVHDKETWRTNCAVISWNIRSLCLHKVERKSPTKAKWLNEIPTVVLSLVPFVAMQL